MLWDHLLFEENFSLAIKIFVSLAIGEYYVVCQCLLVVQVDKGSCSVV